MQDFFVAVVVHIHFFGIIFNFPLFKHLLFAGVVGLHDVGILMRVGRIDAFHVGLTQHRHALAVKKSHLVVAVARIQAKRHIVQHRAQKRAVLQQVLLVAAAHRYVFKRRQNGLAFAVFGWRKHFGDGQRAFLAFGVFIRQLHAFARALFGADFFVQPAHGLHYFFRQEIVYGAALHVGGFKAEHFFGRRVPQRAHARKVLHRYGHGVAVQHGAQKGFFRV